jgi:parallel beta-helix repeat protein
MKCKYLVAATALVAALVGLAPAVQAQDGDIIEIGTSLRVLQPIVITRSGNYVLNRDVINVPGTAIQIEANEVTLDLDGHRIIGPGGRQGVGIAVVGAANVRVRNGHLGRLGIGVQLMGATNVVVEDLQIDGVDSGGAPPDVEIGILLVNSRGCRISNNVITETFLGIFVRGEGSGGNRVTDNVITGGDQGELAICYNPVPGGSGGPDGDLVAGNLVSRFRRGMSFSDGSAGNVVRDNTVAYFDLDIVEASPGQNLIEDNRVVQIVR